jgi:hypothetical protein
VLAFNHLGADCWPVRGWAVRSWSWAVWGRGRSVDGCWSWDIGSWGWDIGSWSRDNNWGRLVSWGWSWSISWGWGSSIDRFSNILNISNITIGISIVGDSLCATIGEGNMVFTVGVVSITSLSLSKLNSAVVVRHSIVVVVGWGSVRVGWLSTISWSWGISWSWSISWSWGVLRSSTGNSHK